MAASTDADDGSTAGALQAWVALHQVGLRPYEARVLLALMQAGTANTAVLAKLSGVPRTSVYQVMDSLTSQRLAESVPSHGSATWFCPGWPTVVDRLDAAREDEQRRHQARTTRLRASLARHLSGNP